jgi:hypothetical protein
MGDLEQFLETGSGVAERLDEGPRPKALVLSTVQVDDVTYRGAFDADDAVTLAPSGFRLDLAY